MGSSITLPAALRAQPPPLVREEYHPWRYNEADDLMSLSYKEAKEKTPQKYSLENGSEQHAKFIEM